ncbi:hypothetical protein DT019_08650 [Streptomyces sp. SDr-06]|nr:hypothetical protein DT019_08650 [Streptomyces sp. SDr-06]
MDRRVSHDTAPALGDLRKLGHGDTIWLQADARQRKDWTRYADALATAIARGADVRWFHA